MARFRLLVIISAIWLTFIFNLERPDFYFFGVEENIDLDSVTYVVAALAALATLWLPDVSRRLEYIFIPTLVTYLGMKVFTGSSPERDNLALVVLEIAVLFVTVAVFRRISMALLSFEHTVDSVLLRPDTLRVMPMEEGLERIQEELSRARRFERKIGIILISSHLQEEEPESHPYRFDLEEQLQKHYLQLRLAQVAELTLYKVDLVVLYKDDVLICMPETNETIVERKAVELREEIRWRLGIDVVTGAATFPEDGFIFRDMVDQATVRMYEAREAYLEALESDSDGGDTPSGSSGASTKTLPPQSTKPSPTVNASMMGQIFQPWPDVVLQAQQHERYGRRKVAHGDQSDLFDPNSWLGALPYQSESTRRLYMFLKRVFDLMLVMLAAPFVVPVLGVLALLIWLEDRGPVFFIQPRTGFGGHQFNMYKFRTMVPDAEEKLKELAAQGLAKLDENGKLAEPLKLERDPRITKIGRILRKTSLDELPQLWNVFRGDMSLVGPRPTSWSVDSYRLFHTERLQVRPGITGLWQVAARGNTNFDEWVDWDRTYVDKMCLSLDVQIFVRTFTKVFQQKGAK